MSSVSTALRQFREHHRFKQRDVARLSGFSPSYLSNVEKSFVELSAKKAKLLIAGYRKLGVDVKDVIKMHVLKQSKSLAIRM